MIEIFTDGSCLGNPGPGGWACIIRQDRGEVELHGGEAATTNNRMELMAAIKGLEALGTDRQRVTLYSDSQLLIKTMTLGWKRNKNHDLWQVLDNLVTRHEVVWEWVRGHAGHPENERCNVLAQKAAQRRPSF
jgi:ribonuclease HI